MQILPCGLSCLRTYLQVDEQMLNVQNKNSSYFVASWLCLDALRTESSKMLEIRFQVGFVSRFALKDAATWFSWRR